MTIDLNHDGLRELLVKGACGNSATSYYFWIFAKKGKHYAPVFFVATMGIDILRKTTKGYSNIEAVGCTANTCFFNLFVFNGRKYVLKREWERPNA